MVPPGGADPASDVGRDRLGRFAGGSSSASVTLAARVRHWRGVLLATVAAGDVQAVYRELLAAALDRSGPRRDQLAAARIFLEYVAGKPEPAGDLEPGPAGRGGFVFRFSGPVLLAGGVDQVRGGEPVAGLSGAVTVSGDGDRQADVVQVGPVVDVVEPIA